MKKTFAIVSLCALAAACGGVREEAPSQEPAAPGLARHMADASLGKQLFIDKGCVICHAVNGVGGKAAPPLDAPIGVTSIDPLEFAARMWRGAPAMIELQSIELGYTIYLEADDISNLAAFAADREVQKTLVLEDLPETVRNGLLDERFWEMEDWDQFLREGQESGFEEAPEESE